jgi:hypothetical protein
MSLRLPAAWSTALVLYRRWIHASVFDVFYRDQDG